MDEQEREWYRFSRDYLAASPDVRRAVSRQTLAHYRKIKRLPTPLGEELDTIRAPFFVVRWIAWASGISAQLLRYAVALEYRERAARWPPWHELGSLGEGPPLARIRDRFRRLLDEAVQLTTRPRGTPQRS